MGRGREVSGAYVACTAVSRDVDSLHPLNLELLSPLFGHLHEGKLVCARRNLLLWHAPLHQELFQRHEPNRVDGNLLQREARRWRFGRLGSFLLLLLLFLQASRGGGRADEQRRRASMYAVGGDER